MADAVRCLVRIKGGQAKGHKYKRRQSVCRPTIYKWFSPLEAYQTFCFSGKKCGWYFLLLLMCNICNI